MISVLHVSHNVRTHGSNNINEYIFNNKDYISAIKMSTDTFMRELSWLNIIETDSQVSSRIVLRKITNRLFNNSFTKSKMPISTPEFVSSFAEGAILNLKEVSFLNICYHYSIPIFIEDAGILNNIVAGDICSDVTLLSSEYDWKIYRSMINMPNVMHFAYGLRPETAFNINKIKLCSGMDSDFPSFIDVSDYKSIESFLEEDVEIENYMYDKLF